MGATLERARFQFIPLTVGHSVTRSCVAAAAPARREGPRQATLARFVRGLEVEVVALDDTLSRGCGELLASTNTSDVIDASVVIVARRTHAPIFTTDVEDLARLDP